MYFKLSNKQKRVSVMCSVYFSVSNKTIVVSINSASSVQYEDASNYDATYVCTTVAQIVKCLKAHNVNNNSDIMCSSTCEFASEEGYANDSDVALLIDEALDALNISA